MSHAAITEAERRLLDLVGDIDPATQKGRRRRRILEVATETFAQLGYRRASISAIASQAQIAKGTLYLYFANKSELLLAATAWEKLKVTDSLRTLFDHELDARSRLRGWIKTGLLFTARSALLSRLISGDEEFNAVLADLPAPFLAESASIQHRILGDLVAEATGEAPRDPEALRRRVTAMTMIFMVAPYLRSPHLRQEMPIEQLAEQIATLIVDGIDPPAPPRGEEGP